MLLRFKSLFILLLTIFLCDSCNKCKDLFQGNVALTSKAKSIIPYDNQSKLLFIGNLPDSIYYSTDSIYQSLFEVTEEPQNNNSECLHYYYGENYGGSLSDSLGRYKIGIGILYRGYPPVKTFGISLLFPPEDSLGDFFSFFTLKGDSLPGNYYPSYKIGNRVFSFVHELSMDSPKADYGDDIYKIYYNNEKGLIGFESRKGKVWYLDKP